MIKRVEEAEKLFKDGYNCSQAVFGAFSDLYGIDQDTALKLSASFGGGLGRMREVCGAVSGMSMIAGLETGSSLKMDSEGKKHNYEVVQQLTDEFKNISGSIICRELLGLSSKDVSETTPQERTTEYYKKRPCVQLVKDAAEIIERVLYELTITPIVSEKDYVETISLAMNTWAEHYDFEVPEEVMHKKESKGYQYYKMVNLGGMAGFFALQTEENSIYLRNIYC